MIEHHFKWSDLYNVFEGSENEWLKFVTDLKDYAVFYQPSLDLFDVEWGKAPFPFTEREPLVLGLKD